MRIPSFKCPYCGNVISLREEAKDYEMKLVPCLEMEGGCGGFFVLTVECEAKVSTKMIEGENRWEDGP